MDNTLITEITENINVLSESDILELRQLLRFTKNYSGQLGLYAVCYINLYPYNPMVKHIDFSKDWTEDEKVLGYFMSGFKNIEKLQIFFSRYFEPINNKHAFSMNSKLQDLYYKDYSKVGLEFCLYQMQHHYAIKFQTLGDSLVIYAPFILFDNKLEIPNYLVLYNLVQACAITMFFAFSEGILFNGCINIGLGEELPDRGIYGEALSEAVKITEQKTIFPRILFSKTCMKYMLQQHIPNKLKEYFACPPFIQQYQNSIIKEILKSTKVDFYKNRTIDFLGRTNYIHMNKFSTLTPSRLRKMYKSIQAVSDPKLKYNNTLSLSEFCIYRNQLKRLNRYVISEKDRWL